EFRHCRSRVVGAGILAARAYAGDCIAPGDELDGARDVTEQLAGTVRQPVAAPSARTRSVRCPLLARGHEHEEEGPRASECAGASTERSGTRRGTARVRRSRVQARAPPSRA